LDVYVVVELPLLRLEQLNALVLVLEGTTVKGQENAYADRITLQQMEEQILTLSITVSSILSLNAQKGRSLILITLLVSQSQLFVL